MPGTRRTVAGMLLLLLSLVFAAGAPSAAGVRRSNLFLRAAGVFDPARNTPRVPADLSERAVLQEPGARRPNDYWIVQFDGPVQEHWKGELLGAGARLYQYLPDHAFVMRLPRGRVRAVRRLKHVRAVTPLKPAYILSPNVLRARNRPLRMLVTVFDTDRLAAVAKAIRRFGGRVLSTSSEGEGIVEAEMRPIAARRLARVPGIAWIEPAPVFRLCNDVVSGIVGVGPPRTDVGLFGNNQIVAVADTGLDNGDAASVGIGAAGTIHGDFRGRILRTIRHTTSGKWNDPHGHGTHVAGTALGSGALSGATPDLHQYGGSLAGIAPEAKLIVQAGDLGAGGTVVFTGLTDTYQLFQAAYEGGARVHSNSWGASTDGQNSVEGQYLTNSRAVDRFTWDHPDMVVCFAAGNGGKDGDRNGTVDTDSIYVPGTAKNCLTVGFSESTRPGVSSTYGSLFGEPIASDKEADNAFGMAANSSRGPCDDPAGPNGERRIKPDLVAPGTYIGSTRTSAVVRATDGFEGETTGSTPAGWSTNFASNWNVKSSDAFTGSKCLGMGDPTTSYPGEVADDAVMILPAADYRAYSWLYVVYRTKYNLRPNDRARVTQGTQFLNNETWITGSSNGQWEYRVERVPASTLTASSLQLTLQLTATAGGTGPFYWLVDDLKVLPALNGTLSRLAGETAESARDNAYHFSFGASMAAPAVAGMAALVREFYQERESHFEPSAALVKATLLASANDLFHSTSDHGQYPGAGFQEQPSARPNVVQGWGLANLQKALVPGSTTYPNTRLLFVDAKHGLRTGEVDEYKIEVGSATPLNVALVYTDRPALAMASITLVNDLDLEIVPPALLGTGIGTQSNGNPGNAPDRRNNVETQDFPDTLTAGTYTIRVSGSNVPEGPQPYALVIYGDAVWASRFTISPATATCQLGRTRQFEAYLDGRRVDNVEWKASSGTITQAGLYTAPSTGTSDTVTATLGTLLATADVNLGTASDIVVVFRLIHDEGADLRIRVGVGPNPASPLGLAIDAILPAGGVSNQFNIPIDSGFNAALPPTARFPWFLEVTDSVSGNGGTLLDFWVEHNGFRYNAKGMPRTISATGTPVVYAWLDPTLPFVEITGPAPFDTVNGTVAITANASDNDVVSHVEFFVDDRLLGTDQTSPYQFTWDTFAETNARHRLMVRAFDAAGNSADAAREIYTANTGVRPHVQMRVDNWSFNATTRHLRAKVTFTNVGGADARNVTLQRLTLFGTGAFAGVRPIYMVPAAPPALPRNIGDLLQSGGTHTFDVEVLVPPDISTIERWSGTGIYFDTSGNRFYL